MRRRRQEEEEEAAEGEEEKKQTLFDLGLRSCVECWQRKKETNRKRQSEAGEKVSPISAVESTLIERR